jgi:hypothetical protein
MLAQLFPLFAFLFHASAAGIEGDAVDVTSPPVPSTHRPKRADAWPQLPPRYQSCQQFICSKKLIHRFSRRTAEFALVRKPLVARSRHQLRQLSGLTRLPHKRQSEEGCRARGKVVPCRSDDWSGIGSHRSNLLLALSSLDGKDLFTVRAIQ